MGKLRPVHCRVCGGEIDREKETEWVMPSKNHFYHKKCFEDWVEKKSDLNSKANDDEWFEALKYYLAHVVKMPINYQKMTSQWNNYLKQSTKTAKGIYFAMRYYYDVLKGDKEKSLGGIGIISSIYNDSRNYWYRREERERGICAKIEEQMREQLLQKVYLVKAPKTAKQNGTRKKVVSLKEIEAMEDSWL